MLSASMIDTCKVYRVESFSTSLIFDLEAEVGGDLYTNRVTIPASSLAGSKNVKWVIEDHIHLGFFRMFDYSTTLADAAFYKAFGKNYHSVIALQMMPSSGTSIAALATKLPGMEHVTTCPVCEKDSLLPYNDTLYMLIQHINDLHNWSREEIADWLDNLHDDGIVDLSFEIKDPQRKELL
jgi:hypothetical protein